LERDVNVSIDDLLLALGEKTAENFALRRDNTRLEQELAALHARIEQKEEPVAIHAQPDPQLWPDRER
jgi:hypothetical protein